jgi:hypothetical protein
MKQSKIINKKEIILNLICIFLLNIFLFRMTILVSLYRMQVIQVFSISEIIFDLIIFIGASKVIMDIIPNDYIKIKRENE